mgnify:CR=1 FL=1
MLVLFSNEHNVCVCVCVCVCVHKAYKAYVHISFSFVFSPANFDFGSINLILFYNKKIQIASSFTI